MGRFTQYETAISAPERAEAIDYIIVFLASYTRIGYLARTGPKSYTQADSRNLMVGDERAFAGNVGLLGYRVSFGPQEMLRLRTVTITRSNA